MYGLITINRTAQGPEMSLKKKSCAGRASLYVEIGVRGRSWVTKIESLHMRKVG
jgi:hypothetical protein